VSPFFKINFSQNISSTSVNVASAPAGFTGKPSVSGKTLTIPLSVPLTSGKTYTITLVHVASINGKTITDAVYRFKPTYIPSADLPEDQQQALLKLEDINGPNPNNPIIQYLPHQTTDFTLSAVSVPTKNPPKLFPLIAIITPSAADMGDEATAVAQYKQEVVNYITSLNLNPATYNITYTVQTP
jgi:hypothetical protein